LLLRERPAAGATQDAKTDASAGTVPALEKIVPAIRRRFGRKVEIVLRADSGFARDTIMDWCERNEVFYCLGLARNQRLQADPQKQRAARSNRRCMTEPVLKN